MLLFSKDVFDGVRHYCFPDGKLVACSCYDNTIHLWSIETGEQIESYSGHVKTPMAVSFSPDGKYIASAGRDNTIKLWKVPEMH